MGMMARLTKTWPRSLRLRLLLLLLVVMAGGLAAATAPSPAAAGAAAGFTLLIATSQVLVDRMVGKTDEAARRRRELVARLEPPLIPAGAPAPGARLVGARQGVAPLVGRVGDVVALSRAVNEGAHSVVVVDGPRWCGKTRLVAEWAAGLGPGWVAGWVAPPAEREDVGSGEAVGSDCARKAMSLTEQVVLLFDGYSQALVGALKALPEDQRQVRVVIAVHDHLALCRAVARESEKAGRACENAWVRHLRHAGARVEHEGWYEDFVRAYAARLGKPSVDLSALPTSAEGMSLGMLNACALAAVVGQQPRRRRLRVDEVLAVLWAGEVRAWAATRNDPRWALPPLNEQEAAISVAAVWVSGELPDEGLSQLLVAVLGRHQDHALSLLRWVHEVLGRDASLTAETALLPLSALLVQPPARDSDSPPPSGEPGIGGRSASLVRLLAAISQLGTQAVRQFLVRSLPALRFLPDSGWIVEAVIDGDGSRLLAAADAISITGECSREVDLALAAAIEITQPDAELTDQLKATLQVVSPPHAQTAIAILGLQRLSVSGEGPHLAGALKDLSTRLVEVGRTKEAVKPAKQAVAIYRELATADPATYESALASSLNDLGNTLAEAGRRQEALKQSEAAVAILRRLAAVNPAAHEPNLAVSLNNLGNRLAQVGRRDEGLIQCEASLVIRRRLVAADPARYEPALASSLNNLANRLAEAGRREEALKQTEAAVGILRRLSAANPKAHEPTFAMYLNNFGTRLAQVGRKEEALEQTEAAVAILRRLSAANPTAHEPDLAMYLSNLGNRLAQIGRREEALAPTVEAVAIRRRLSAANPTAHEPDLAMYLNNLGNRLAQIGRREEALAPTVEAVAIRRRLSAANPTAHEADFASSLHNLGNRLAQVGRREEALIQTEAAVAIRRRLAAANPSAHEPDLAMSLVTLGNRLRENHRHDSALIAKREAARIYGRLARSWPEAFADDFNEACASLRLALRALGHADETIAAEIVAIRSVRPANE